MWNALISYNGKSHGQAYNIISSSIELSRFVSLVSWDGICGEGAGFCFKFSASTMYLANHELVD